MTPRPTFNLIDAAWIPCVRNDGSVESLGLKEILVQAPCIRAVVDPSPLVTASIHRLLIAILHRTHGPGTIEEWTSIWTAGEFDLERIDSYPFFADEEKRSRFDLFDEERPFYQTVEIHEEYAKPIAQVSHEMLLGTPPSLFQQVAAGLAYSPAQAARAIIAHHSFALPGTLTNQQRHGEPKAQFGSAVAGPMQGGFVALAQGKSLFETLMLNLHRYDGEDGAPFMFDPTRDLAAWERDDPPRCDVRTPTGYIDLLTWQSRRIRLITEVNGSTVNVPAAVVVKGPQFPDYWTPFGHETMQVFVTRKSTSREGPPAFPMSFNPERALWRNSHALFQSVNGQSARPKTADWIAELAVTGSIPESSRFAIDLLGFTNTPSKREQKQIFKVTLWRHERLMLPVALLTDEGYAPLIARALDAAEDAGHQLRPGFDKRPSDGKRKKSSVPRPMQLFASAMLAPGGDRSPDPGDITKLVDSLNLDERYWSRLEGPFRDFLSDLPAQRESALAKWIDTVETITRTAFRETMRSFDTSSRALKAGTLAIRRFDKSITDALERHRSLSSSLTVE